MRSGNLAGIVWMLLTGVLFVAVTVVWHHCGRRVFYRSPGCVRGPS